NALQAESDELHADVIEQYRECTIRAFLLFLVGATIFTNKSAQYVDVIFLQYFQDLNTVNQWNWGASGLAYLYNYMDIATIPKTSHHGVYSCLLQAWIMAHFETIYLREIDPLYNHVDPVAARFFPGKGHKYPHTYRTFLDRLEVDDCTFSPYEDHRQSI
ncbi:hypothetical protein TSUD_423770, partial [Trifolium subterraneum]